MAQENEAYEECLKAVMEQEQLEIQDKLLTSQCITKQFSPVSPVSVYSIQPKPDLKPRIIFETDFGFTRFQRDFLKPESET